MMAEKSVLVSLVEEFVSGLQDSKAKDTAAGLKNGEFTILQLVEALGLSLTSTQPQTRARGIKLLSDVLEDVDLTEKEVEVLKAFYENRLGDDHITTPPVLQGLRILIQSPKLPPGAAVSILKSIFHNVYVRSLLLADRVALSKMLLNVMDTREAELKDFGADFVFGFIQSIDGESDPRNILLAFQIAKKIIQRGYSLDHYTEDLFDVTSCYFPVDFTPPPNDPRGITREELVQELRQVLTGTPKFAQFLLPLIIEKLDSDVQSAKLDSLQTLAAGVATYEHEDLAEFLEGLWASLRREVFQTSSEKIESAGLAALTAITSCLSRSIVKSDSEDALSTFLDMVLKDCKHHLSEPDLKLMWPSAKLLQAACSASNRASHMIVAAVMPALIEQYNSKNQCSHRRTLLEVMLRFIQSVKSSESSENEERVLSGICPSLCCLTFAALSETNSSLQITATAMLMALARQSGLLEKAQIELAVDHLARLLLSDEDDAVSLAVVSCAGGLAELHPGVFISNMIPRMKKAIFSESMELDGESIKHTQSAVRQRCLSMLAAVSAKPSVAQESTSVLLEVLDAAHSGKFGFSLEEAVLACISLKKIAELVEDTQDSGRCFHDIIIPRLLSLALQAALKGESSSTHQSPLAEEAVLSTMVAIISTACSRLQPTLAGQTAAKFVSLFLDGDVLFLPGNSFPPHIKLLANKQHDDSWKLSQTVCLLMACVCSLPRTVAVPQLERLLSELEEMSCTCSHPMSYTSAAKCFAGLVNKIPSGDSLDSLLQKTMTRILNELNAAALGVRMQAFTLLIWVAKALLLRYHPTCTTLTDKLFSLLDDADLGSAAADSFSLLMSDSADVLSRGCHADVRIMYRQRFFSENSAKLVQGFTAAPQEKKPNYLKALSNIVNKLPKQVQVTELPALLSLLLEALTYPDQGVQLSTLSCLEPVIADPPPALIQQLEALMGRLLPLTSAPTMNVKIASLRCIYALSRFPEHEVLPFRARVLRALARPLDDKKRLVRKEAVQARGEWFLLGSPGGR
ncbi:MMS19 nucleotide excision repair protein homolog [Syngnathus scovelli]|uniref:MMS19 nucleotide excision repair protein homolog n=1 Tax=Syngnathus scovelli TaxID=161590 RepID=UPI00210F4947|nr:MMS19 nucleotide excision repair protein homolog [Syngnathus scovelli]